MPGCHYLRVPFTPDGETHKVGPAPTVADTALICPARGIKVSTLKQLCRVRAIWP
ncbi:hypothetical protein GCM10009825_09280 [Arthrobacter humicola]|uniref:Uncharacterized protein n=1 Tax=Arthrobacter humicola TaxID=409291 RepID=A0ABN2YLT5_9MICC